jgi:hypothetical protein
MLDDIVNSTLYYGKRDGEPAEDEERSMTAQHNQDPRASRATIPAGPFTLMVTPWGEPSFDPTGGVRAATR